MNKSRRGRAGKRAASRRVALISSGHRQTLLLVLCSALLQAQGSTFDGGAAGQRHDQKETKERRIDRAGRVLLCVPLPLPYLQICATVPCTRCVARASSITIEASVARKRPESAHGAFERQCWREEQATRRM